jgi:Mrp family chromosome partitioning ATPase
MPDSEKRAAAPVLAGIGRVAHILAIASGKGGVGKRGEKGSE